MQFLHSTVDVGAGQAVVVNLDHAANVQVLDESNFGLYRRGSRYQYYGGYYSRSPVVIRPPRPGRYHVAIDLGGRSGTLRPDVRVL